MHVLLRFRKRHRTARKRRSGVGRRLDAASDFDRTWREEENASSILMIAGG
jgi:hypothetical protein